MKIGIISDIHSHLAPLEKALALLDQHGVDQIVCAGDVVGEGYEGDAVVKLLQEREILCVQGNHDEEEFAEQARIRRQMRKDEEPHRLLLDSWTTAYVSSLPLTRSFKWEGLTVCLAHGTPTSNKAYLFQIRLLNLMSHNLRSLVMLRSSQPHTLIFLFWDTLISRCASL